MKKTISLITWNVWFDTFVQKTRYQKIFSTCQTLSPDIICFQEATLPFLQLLNESPLIHRYILSDPKGNTIRPYGTLTLIKSDLNPTFSYHSFPTRMGRSLLLSTLSFESGSFAFGNVHLESLDNQPTRYEQLKISADVLKEYDSFALCGDFNFCSYKNFSGQGELENNSLKELFPGVSDLWTTLHPEEKGYTFCGNVNSLVTNPNEIMRYDRIISKLSPYWKAADIQIIGDSPLEEDGPVASPGSPQRSRPLLATLGTNVIKVFPSDHFGLFSRFEHI